MSATYGPFDAVIAIETVDDHRAIVEHYMGTAVVLSAEDDCPFGIEAAAEAWAKTTGAVRPPKDPS